ncbi:MAG: phosphoribosylformylglycinamidine cyclo-ligase [Candidatus Eisenbacteria bacterium]|nr:phosphoribosylformylglycinamidine cyclo-ligase [Candidatus Eisenbacteria bacterium]
MSRSHRRYAASGVNIDAGHEAVRMMAEAVRSTWSSGVMERSGGFAGLFDYGTVRGQGDILALTVDGVGTKLKVAAMCERYDTVGMDIVNHCTNDLLPARARPLLFADYFASASISPEVVSQVVGGMAEACRAVGCSLIGGETAEMPGVYCPAEFDIVGCMVGLARRSDVMDGEPVRPGDVLIGLPSSGLHTNGYSLARQLFFDVAAYDVDTHLDELGCTVGEELLKVHREYLSVLGPYIGDPGIHALAHITGGGLYDNVARVLPDGCSAHFDKASWEPPPVFQMLRALGNLDDAEAYRTFNMGVGMVVIVAAEDADRLLQSLSSDSSQARVVGDVRQGDAKVAIE